MESQDHYFVAYGKLEKPSTSLEFITKYDVSGKFIYAENK